MGIHRIQITLPRDTVLGEDVTTNTFHMTWDTNGNIVAADVDQLAVFFSDFYAGTAVGATAPIKTYLSSVILHTAVKMKLYNLSDPTPRVPYAERTLTMGAWNASSPFPEEAAIAVTLKHTAESGENQRRMRGRVFLGPLNAASAGVTAGRVRVPDNVRTNITLATKRLAEEIGGMSALTSALCVYSPTTQEAHAVDSGWVDDAFDTIRGRGPGITAKTLFSVT